MSKPPISCRKPELSSTIRHRIGMAALRSQEPPCRTCALAHKPHVCASRYAAHVRQPTRASLHAPMWVCLSGDLCVDLEDTDAGVGHAPPVSQDPEGWRRAWSFVISGIS